MLGDPRARLLERNALLVGRAPLAGILRAEGRYAEFRRDAGTEPGFELPKPQTDFNVRAGLRWGGQEPLMMPRLAAELSVWYEGRLRTASGAYGYDNDRRGAPQAGLGGRFDDDGNRQFRHLGSSADPGPGGNAGKNIRGAATETGADIANRRDYGDAPRPRSGRRPGACRGPRRQDVPTQGARGRR